jgi:hypothetical protein
MSIKIPSVVALSFAAGIFSLRAQPASVQQLQNSQQAIQQLAPLYGLQNTHTNAPELYEGENMDVGPQRILRLNPRPNYFEVLLDSQAFYTDNANFDTSANAIRSMVFVNTAQMAFTPPGYKWGPGTLSPVVGFYSQWYNYENTRMSPFDFEAQTVFVNGRYATEDWQFTLGANYTRLLNQSDYEQTYQEFLPNIGAQRTFHIGETMLFAIGNEVQYHFSEVPATTVNIGGGGTIAGTGPADINNRLDDIVSLTYAWQITRQMVLQPYYRFQYSYYRYDTLATSSRNDYLHTVGVTLYYFFNRNASLRTFFNYSLKQSDDPYTPAYHEYDGGLGAALDVTF